MDRVKEIEKAIGAHGMWKARLIMALDTGHCDTPIESVRSDSECEFGKWLNDSSFSSTEKESAIYKLVRRNHAKFHQIAANVCTLINTGKNAEAQAMLANGGAFQEASAKLTTAMIELKKTARG